MTFRYAQLNYDRHPDRAACIAGRAWRDLCASPNFIVRAQRSLDTVRRPAVGSPARDDDGWDLIEAIRILRGEPVKGILIGSGTARPILEARAREYGLGDQMRLVQEGGAWKIAYADFVTAMMAFFLVMWLISASDEKR